MALTINSLTVPPGILNLRLTPTILFFVAAGVSLATFNSGIPFTQNGATVAPGTSTGIPVSDIGAAAALNALRSGTGLPTLTSSDILKTAAQLHNADMINNTFVGLASSTGKSPQAQVDELAPGVFTDVSMVVFVGTSGTSTTTFSNVLSAWVANPTVNSTLFNPTIDHFGLSEVNANGTTFWTLIVAELAPASPVTFTGNLSTTSNVISSVSSTTGLSVGMTITGVGIPAGTTITAVGSGQITISKTPTTAGTGVTLTAQ